MAIKPNPVMSVAARTPNSTATSAPSRLSCTIHRIASATCAASALSFFAAVVIQPVPTVWSGSARHRDARPLWSAGDRGGPGRSPPGDFRLFILNRMPTRDHGPGFAHFFCHAQDDLRHHIWREIGRQCCDVQRDERLTTHRIHIAQAFAAAIAPYWYGSSTIGVKKSVVMISARRHPAGKRRHHQAHLTHQQIGIISGSNMPVRGAARAPGPQGPV